MKRFPLQKMRQRQKEQNRWQYAMRWFLRRALNWRHNKHCHGHKPEPRCLVSCRQPASPAASDIVTTGTAGRTDAPGSRQQAAGGRGGIKLSQSCAALHCDHKMHVNRSSNGKSNNYSSSNCNKREERTKKKSTN